MQALQSKGVEGGTCRNGNPDSENIVHVGHAASLDEVRENMGNALRELVAGLWPGVLVENEWGSVSSHCCFWSFGYQFHNIFRRGWLRAFGPLAEEDRLGKPDWIVRGNVLYFHVIVLIHARAAGMS